MSVAGVVAVKLNTHASMALFQLAIGVLFLYITIAFFIASTYTEDAAKTTTQVLGYITLVVGTGYGLISLYKYRTPLFSFEAA